MSQGLNIVVSAQQTYTVAGSVVVHDLPAAFAAAGGADEIFVLGGAKLFRDTIEIADRIYLTIVHARLAGDVLFPEIPDDFTLVEKASAQDIFPLDFLRYDRIVSPAEKPEIYGKP